MSETRWTREQRLAIEMTGCNLLVSASAGSGKTAVLVERVIHRLLHLRGDLDRLLVVTFTEAAAAEMRDRIAAVLQAALATHPADKHVQEQLALLDRASISTLHAFCLATIRQHFYRLDVDPDFRILDEAEAVLLRSETLAAVLEERYRVALPNSSFYSLVERFGGQDGDGSLRRLILDLYEFSESQMDPSRWLSGAQALFTPPPGTSIDDLLWVPVIFQLARRELERALSGFRRAFDICRWQGGPAHYLPVLEDDWAILNDALAALRTGKWANVQAAFRQGLATVRAKAAKDVDVALREAVKKIRERTKKTYAQLYKRYFSQEAEAHLAELRDAGVLMQVLVELVEEFRAAYRAAKDRAAALDFGDLERLSLQLLSMPDVASQLQAQFDEVLIDEYQDINPVQEVILQRVSRNVPLPNRFMVGDVKQSIYRFRLADPSIFLEKYKTYAALGPGSGDLRTDDTGSGDTVRIDLQENFRCRSEVVDAINFLFRQILTAEVGELAYDERAELVCAAEYPPLPNVGGAVETTAHRVELHLVESDTRILQDAARTLGRAFEEVDGLREEWTAEEGENDGRDGEESGDRGDSDALELMAAEREARLVVRRIQALVTDSASWAWDKREKRYRRLSYRDIVVLMRATQHRANSFAQIFRREGIPVYATSSTGYFAAPEVETMISLLQILDNPRQDIPLVGILRSPIVGLSSADLAGIRLISRQGDFYEAVRRAASTHPRLADFLRRLDEWRTLARRAPLSELVWTILRETGYLDFAGGLPGGAERQANLRAFYDRARQFDQFSRQGLPRFLAFVQELRDADEDLGAAAALGENDDVVRIMSIHKSKGLEFPVVFVVGLGSGFNREDQKSDLLVHSRLGMGQQIIDRAQGVKYPSLPLLAIRYQIKMEALAEELRVLYVALTRARERLILVGSARDLEENCVRWCDLVQHREWALPEAHLAGTRSYLDWIGWAIARHQAGVPIRHLAGDEMRDVEPLDPAVRTDVSRWQISLWKADQVVKVLGSAGDGSVASMRESRLEPLPEARLPEGRSLQELERRLQWQYDWAFRTRLAAKVTVTELKRRVDPHAAGGEDPGRYVVPSGLIDRPGFMQDSHTEPTSAELGTAVHVVLQHLELSRALDEQDLKGQVESLVRKELLTEEQAKAVDAGQLAAFFRRPLGSRIRRHGYAVQREVPFTLALPAGQVYGSEYGTTNVPPRVGTEDRVLVQGVIDCLWHEPQGIVLVDFKTDRKVSDRRLQEYRLQVSFYRQALEEIYRMPVVEAYLVFVRMGFEEAV